MNPGSIPGEASKLLKSSFRIHSETGRQVMKHGGEPPYTSEQDRENWLDLSTGINSTPYPTPIIDGSAWQALPLKRDLDAVLHAARDAYKVPKNLEILAGPGTEALIWQLPGILGGAASILGPTYSSHAASWARWNIKPSIVSSTDAWPKNQHLVVVNPNNPTSDFIEPETLVSFAQTLEPGCLLIVDEAFMDCTPERSVIPHLKPNLPILVLRSFGKFFGLAGLRLGFAIGQPNIIEQLGARYGDWSVSGPALQIGACALADQSWQTTMRRHLRSRMNQLLLFLKRPDTIVGHTDLFLLYNHQKADELHEFLAQQRIWTRVFADHPTWIRFGAPGSIKDFSRLAQGFYDFYEMQRGTPG